MLAYFAVLCSIVAFVLITILFLYHSVKIHVHKQIETSRIEIHAHVIESPCQSKLDKAPVTDSRSRYDKFITGKARPCRYQIHCHTFVREPSRLPVKSFCLRDRDRHGNEVRPISLKIGTQNCYVDLCNMPKFQFQRPFLSRVLDISPSGVPRGWFSVQFCSIFNLSFSNVQLISDKKKTIYVMPYF